MSEVFDKFETFFTKLMKDSGLGTTLLADGLVTNYTELFKMFDRTELIQELKEKAQKGGLLAKDWVPNASRIDYMSSSERDMRLRARNRIQAMRLRNSPKVVEGIAQFSEAMTKIESS